VDEPLAGFTVAVTAARRREELVGLLVRRGARVVEAPAIRIVATGDDEELLATTRACIAAAPDVVVATTGIGFRGWMEAADGWGLGDQLRARFASSELLTRGPKAKGAVRAAGLSETWSPDSESSDEVLARLLAEGVAGRRVVVQLHGEPLLELTTALRDAGAEVLEVPVYRWVPPEDVRPVHRLVEQLTTRGSIDCLTFTSAPAVASLLRVAEQDGRTASLLAALAGDVLVACVGPVTAAPLERLGVPTVQPARARLGALVRTVVEHLPARSRALAAGDHLLELRGHSVLVDGRPVELSGRQAGVLAALVRADGDVLSRGEILREVWSEGGRDEHAVEMTVGRLRSALGPAGSVVETVVKRGYRIAAPASSS
jgi:uroporphyrinogen-III synthase